MQQVQQVQHRKSPSAAAAALYTPVTKSNSFLHAARCSIAARVLCILLFRNDNLICRLRYIGARKSNNSLTKCCGINVDF